MPAEKPYDLLPPGGQFQDLVGPSFAGSTVVTISKMIHHVLSTAQLSTIVPPHEGFAGPVYLVADSLYTLTTGGNIAATFATVIQANHAYGFIYDQKRGKWYPLGISF